MRWAPNCVYAVALCLSACVVNPVPTPSDQDESNTAAPRTPADSAILVDGGKFNNPGDDGDDAGGHDPGLFADAGAAQDTVGAAADSGGADAPAGDAPAGDTPAGDAPAGDAPAGDTPAGDAPAGDAPAGDAPVGDN